jgi:Reverse transcriptase (RNA-dependent DNA polymerase)
MVRSGIAKPSISPYASNVVVVKKSDGSWRLCIDHRQLNMQTVTDPFICPRVEDTIYALSNNIWLSQVDVRHAYYNVKIRDSDTHKTAFLTKSGHWELLRMNFGLKKAPASWARCFDFILSGVHPTYCVAYFDDITIVVNLVTTIL